jgi:hypothetical protein
MGDHRRSNTRLMAQERAKEGGEGEEASTSKTTTAMTTEAEAEAEAEAETATTRDTSSRRRMRAGEEEEEAKGHRGDTHHRTRTTRREGEGTRMAGVVTRGCKAAEDEEARTSMRRSRRREEIAEGMAGEEMRLHHEATAGDTKARLDRLGLTWGEEGFGRGGQIQVVSVLPFPCTEAATDDE